VKVEVRAVGLKAFQENRGLTQRQLATTSHVSPITQLASTSALPIGETRSCGGKHAWRAS
jgi:hypothetical protein